MVFLAGSEFISVFDRQNGSRVAVIAPGNKALALTYKLYWNALRHDVRGGHLLATSDSGHLLWTPRYSDALRGSVRGALLDTGRSVTQLCVANGRAAFVISVRLFPSCECKRV
jgi:hypothetical protein